MSITGTSPQQPSLDWPSTLPDQAVGRFGTHPGTNENGDPVLVPEAEPSGLAAVGTSLYSVSDNGTIGWKDAGGTWWWKRLLVPVFPDWEDFESITHVPSRPGYLYVGVERGAYGRDASGIKKEAPIVVEVKIANLQSEAAAVNGEDRWWALTTTAAGGQTGMEGMTFVPDGQHPYSDSSGGFGGLFFAASQASDPNDAKRRRIDVYDLPLHRDANGVDQPCHVEAVTGPTNGPGPLFLDLGKGVGKISDLGVADSALWILCDDERGDEKFPVGAEPDPAAYDKDYHKDPATGDQRLQQWRFGSGGAYAKTYEVRPPKVGCEALCFQGSDLLLGYDQSDRQAYRNDWHCPKEDEVLQPDNPRLRLPPNQIWCERWKVKPVKDDPTRASRAPTAYYNYVRRYSGFLDQRIWEVRSVPTVSTTFNFKNQGKKGAEVPLTIRWPVPGSLPEGFSWLGQIVAGPESRNPPATMFVLRWRGPGASPLVGVRFCRYLWNDKGSGSSDNLRIWGLEPQVPAGDTALYQAVGVFFERIASDAKGDQGYGGEPDPAQLTGLAALRSDFCTVQTVVGTIWTSQGLDRKNATQTKPRHPEYEDLVLAQCDDGTGCPFTAMGTVPPATSWTIFVPKLTS